MTLSKSQQSRAFSRAVMDEKPLSPLFPTDVEGEGAVVTNDFCINSLSITYLRKVKSLTITRGT